MRAAIGMELQDRARRDVMKGWISSAAREAQASQRLSSLIYLSVILRTKNRNVPFRIAGYNIMTTSDKDMALEGHKNIGIYILGSLYLFAPTTVSVHPQC